MLYDTRIPNKLIMVVAIVYDDEFLPLYANTLGDIADSYWRGLQRKNNFF